MIEAGFVETGTQCYLAAGSAVVRVKLLGYLQGEWSAFAQVAVSDTRIGSRGEMLIVEVPAMVRRADVYLSWEAAEAALQVGFVKAGLIVNVGEP